MMLAVARQQKLKCHLSHAKLGTSEASLDTAMLWLVRVTNRLTVSPVCYGDMSIWFQVDVCVCHMLQVVGKVSLAAKGLCLWVRAMETYGTVAKDVAPKRNKLKTAQDNLAKKQTALAAAQTQLAEVLAKVQALKVRPHPQISHNCQGLSALQHRQKS